MKLIGRIGFIWFVFWFAIIFLLLYPAFLILLSKEKWYPLANRLRKVWAHAVVFLSFIRVKGLGKLNISKKPAIYVANHTSYMDIIAFGLFVPEKVCFVAKMELARIPLFGIFFRTVDIAVNRGSAMASHKSMMIAADRIKKGYSVIIFPEGTIGPSAPKLKTFKNGAFKLAMENNIPVIPVTFYNNYRILPDEKYEFYPGCLKYKVHRAEPTNHLKHEEYDILKEKIFTIIEKDLKES